MPVSLRKNKYVHRSRISEAKFRELVRYFALDLEAQKISVLSRLNRNTVNRYLLLIRERIADYCNATSAFSLAIPVREGSDAPLPKGTGGEGFPLFGVIQLGERIYTESVPEGIKKGAQDLIRGRIEARDVINANGWRGYHGLLDLSRNRHYHILKSPNGGEDFTRPHAIDAFWSFSKMRLMKFHGVPESTLHLHLKECEFRFNHRRDDIYALVLKIIRERPLS